MSGHPAVTTVRHGPVALILADNPPVNAIGHAVRAGLSDAIEDASRDAQVEAVVIACRGRTFFAGADIAEFGRPRQAPLLPDVCDAIEGCAKPVVAAIHGTALGGGMEIALACHYRIATPDAALGLPEVKLGIFPGAGGGNRLARLIGAEEALRIVLSGDRIAAARAHELGIVDVLASGALEASALAYAQRLLAARAGPRATRALEGRLAASRADIAAFDRLAAELTRRSAGQHAPAACVASIRRALTMAFDAAIAADRRANAELMAGDQSKALRHVFFAERQAAKLPFEAEPRRVDRVAILGAGTMGGGIAMSFAAAGVPVVLIDATREAAERGVERVRATYATSVKRGSIAQREVDRRMALIRPSGDRLDAADADLVIEAVFEDLALKQQIFADLERICAGDAVLATNTSALDVDAIAAAMARPGRFVGMHFFSPANVMKLCEVVRAAATDRRALATAVAVARRIAKVPVVSGNCDGFIGNRMVARRGAQAERLLQEGALPHEVDAALRGFGFAMGPLETNDMSGLDIGYAIRKRRGTHFPIADAIAESGRLGQKTGAGYYRYEPGSRTPVPDPAVAALIEATSARLGIARRAIGGEEMAERMIFALINEGARIVDEGIAARPSDVDVVWIHGYGFPRWRGGPLFYADQVGLGHVAERLDRFARDSGDASLAPARLLRELADAGSTFAEWQKAQA